MVEVDIVQLAGAARTAARREAATVGRICRLGAHCLVLTLLVLAGPAVAEGGSVNCYDAERNIVQRKLAQECKGRVVDDGEARVLLERARAARLGRLQGPKTPPAGGSGRRFATAFPVAEDGHLLTARHAVEGCTELWLEDESNFNAPLRVVAISETDDIALLHVRAQFVPPAWRKPGHPLLEGTPVAAIGYPNLALPVVKPLRAEGTVLREQAMVQGRPMIQIQAEIYGGNSGGPLVDESGRIVGMVVAKIDTVAVYRNMNQVLRNMAFAVPAAAIRQFLDGNGIRLPEETDLEVTTATVETALRINCVPTVDR